MLFRLCREWGGRYIHPDFLAEDLTIAQIDDWIRYWTIERFGPPAEDYRAGLIAWAALAGGRGTKSTPDRLAPKWSSEPLTPDEYREKARLKYERAAAMM